jgi:N-acyl-L-homoserine lactone synthetase
MSGGGFRVEGLDWSDAARCDAYARFRSDYFGRYLGWKVLDENGHDRNAIDPLSAHYCLVNGGGEVVGGIRLTPPGASPWMVDMSPFSELLDGQLDPRYPRAESAEVSRLGALPEAAGQLDPRGYSAAQALRRAAYQHSVRSGLRYWYVVAYRALIERLRRYDYLPFRIISPTVRLDPKGRTCVACLDLADAFVNMARHAPAFLEWNNEGLGMADLAVLMHAGGRP